jgi:hypothetical protein
MNDARPAVPINRVAGSGLPFHCAIEHGEKPVPFAVSATGGPVSDSTAAFLGEIELRTGDGRVVPVGNAVSENLREFEFVAGPPDTVIATAPGSVPRKAVSCSVIAAVSCVALTTVVGRGEPFQLTTSPSAKPVPVTVKVRPVWLQYGVLFAEVVDAESDVMVGRTIENGTALDDPPPQLTPGMDVQFGNEGFNTVTWVVATEAMSAAGTVAISWVGFS